VAIDKSSANNLLTLSQQKTKVGAAGTHGESGRKSNGEMQCVWALIDCGATSIFMTLRRFNQLGISHQAAHIITLAMTGGMMQHAKNSRKTQITV